MSLPNRCPHCGPLADAGEKIDPTVELEMRVGHKPVKELYSMQPAYLPHEHGAILYRLVVCANCGAPYMKEVDAPASLPRPPEAPKKEG